MGSLRLHFVSLMLLALLVLATAADTAFLVVHKKAALQKVKGGERVNVAITLHNAGSAWVCFSYTLFFGGFPFSLFFLHFRALFQYFCCCSGTLSSDDSRQRNAFSTLEFYLVVWLWEKMKWVCALVGDGFCSTAYDVSLTDDTWPSALFSLVSGNTSRTWEKLEA